ncbi:MAG: C39 family peptidase [Clostridiales bacterium]|nr:C39 family peptidase [Clostridiales bacterium]
MKRFMYIFLALIISCSAAGCSTSTAKASIFKPIAQYKMIKRAYENAVIEENSEKELPEEYLIEDFPYIAQMPELPTGCEITALTMVLNYYGYDADKVVMATDYLPTLYNIGLYKGADGKTYGNDMNSYFIGNPKSSNGIICGTTAIVTAADSYLADCGSTMTATDMTGLTLEELYRLVSEDTPCVVWCTTGMKNRVPVKGWYTEDGSYVDYSHMDHGAVLIGYSADKVTIADPLAGIVEYSREQFEKVFESRSNQCVILEDNK